MTTIPKALAAGACLLAMTAGASMAEPYIPTNEMAGTIWVAKAPPTWTSIDSSGKTTVSEADYLYVKFRAERESADVICLHWWNEEAGVSVMEFAMVLPEGENVFAYTEVNQSQDSSFPGIHGSGRFTLLDDGTASFTQMGHLADGSAAAFVAELERVDEEPQTPIPHTFPAM